MRSDPLSDQEFLALRDGASRIQWSAGPIPDEKRKDYVKVVETLWATGVHPSVLARPREEIERFGPKVERMDRYWRIIWRRPKTQRWMTLPIPADLADWLTEYLTRPLGAGSATPGRFDRRSIHLIVRKAGELAGLKGISPLTLRHSLGYRITIKQGPAAAKDALGCGDRAIQFYTRLSDHVRERGFAEALGVMEAPNNHAYLAKSRTGRRKSAA